MQIINMKLTSSFFLRKPKFDEKINIFWQLIKKIFNYKTFQNLMKKLNDVKSKIKK
jgi:hypothetical protein